MKQTHEKWWEEMITDEAKQKSDIAELIEAIVSEAERRGYERAMEDVKEASASSVMTLNPSVEPEPVLIIPKSFFEKV